MKVLGNSSLGWECARLSGRTFRHILCALNSASSGKKVLYVTSNEWMRGWTYRRARDICKVYHSSVESGEFNMIEFPGGGYVKFTSDKELRAVGDSVIAKDTL